MTTAVLIAELKDAGIISNQRFARTWWLADDSNRFLAFFPTRVDLYSWNPGAANVNILLDSVPMKQATTESIASLV